MSHAQSELSRVVVVGTCGAGKSTSGFRLAQQLGHRFIELDELFWGRNWQPKPSEQFLSLVRQAVSGEQWVVAGNYSSARTEVWPRATAIIWLNFSLGVVLWRVVVRTASRLIRRQVLWHGNRESAIRTLFTKESIIWWAITTHSAHKKRFAKLRASGEYPHLRWYEFTCPAELERFLVAGG